MRRRFAGQLYGAPDISKDNSFGATFRWPCRAADSRSRPLLPIFETCSERHLRTPAIDGTAIKVLNPRDLG